jgi:hypothetical protein
MDDVKANLDPVRDFTGAYAGQCIDRNESNLTFAAFDVPEDIDEFEVSFYRNIETFSVDTLPITEFITVPHIVTDRIPATNSTATRSLTATQVPQTSRPTSSPPLLTASVKGTRNINARSCASTDCSIVGVVTPNEEVKVLDIEGDWYYVELSNGENAYVFGSLVNVVEVVVAPTATSARSNSTITATTDEEIASLIKTSFIFVAPDLEILRIYP